MEARCEVITKTDAQCLLARSEMHPSVPSSAVAMSFRGIVAAALCASRFALVTGCPGSGHNGKHASFQRFGQAIGLSPRDIRSIGKQCAEAHSDTNTL